MERAGEVGEMEGWADEGVYGGWGGGREGSGGKGEFIFQGGIGEMQVEANMRSSPSALFDIISPYPFNCYSTHHV